LAGTGTAQALLIITPGTAALFTETTTPIPTETPLPSETPVPPTEPPTEAPTEVPTEAAAPGDGTAEAAGTGEAEGAASAEAGATATFAPAAGSIVPDLSDEGFGLGGLARTFAWSFGLTFALALCAWLILRRAA